MWSFLDLLLLLNTIRNGQPIWLPFGWVLGAITTTVILCKRGTWQWTWRETLALVCASNAATISCLKDGHWGIIASIAAMTFAGLPMLIDNLFVPVRAMFMLWSVTVVGCLLSIMGADGSPDSTLLPWCSLAYNGAMAIIVLRKPKAAVAAK